MNAIINLNHFCEIHGPQTIFHTQTIRERSNIQSAISSSNCSSNTSNPLCNGCSSIGSKTVFQTEDKDSSIMFVSSEKSFFGKDNQSALKTTALRSLSCEITANNLVYFGDARLNSLCYTFKVKDSLARGFEKLYSIVIVMKDKMFLLNTQPFLSNNIKDIANQIQESAQKIYEAEQKQFPQRAERLNTGKPSNAPQRSLKELTGESNIFAHLHSLFSWILWAGSRYFTEVLTLGTPSIPALMKDDVEGFAFIQIDKEEFLMKNFPSHSNETDVLAFHDSSYNLRALKSLCSSTAIFNQILYCSLVGVQIVIRGEMQRCSDFSKHFKDFLPTALHRFIAESAKYIPSNKCKVLCLPSDALIPNNNICRIEFMNENREPTLVKCPIDLPSKLPALMVKILHAIDEKLFTNVILDKFVKALVEEWKNKIICLSHQHDDLSKLKRTLGIQPQDETLVNYWLSAF